jgi:hypothetical protein
MIYDVTDADLMPKVALNVRFGSIVLKNTLLKPREIADSFPLVVET